MVDTSYLSNATNWLTQTKVPSQLDKSPLETLGSLQSLINAQSQNDLQKQQLLNEQQSLKNLQLTNQTGQQALGQKMSVRHSQIMFGLIKTPDDKIYDAASSALDKELQTGELDQQRHDVMRTFLDKNKDNPTAIREQMLTGLIGNLSGTEALAAMTGGTTDTQVGDVNVTRRQPSPYESVLNPNAPITTVPGGSQKRTLSPGEQATTVETTDYRQTIPDPNDPTKNIPNPNFNTPQKLFLGDLARALGHGNWMTPDGKPAPSPFAPPPSAVPIAPPQGGTPMGQPPISPVVAPAVAPVPGPPGGNSLLAPPVAPAPPMAAPASVPPPAAATPPPPGATAPPTFRTGPSNQQTKLAEVSNAQYAAHQQMATNYKQSMYPTERVYQLATTPNVNLGKGSDFWNQVYQTINSQVPDWVRQHGITPRNIDDVAHREEIDKYLVQSMMASSPFAGQSDMMMATAAAGQPSGGRSNEAVTTVTSAIIGLRRMELAGYNAFQQYAKDHNLDPQTVSHAYTPFLTDWQKNIDPRAFMFDMLKPSALKKLTDSLSDKKPSNGGMSEEDKFRFTYNLAKQQGMYNQKPPPEQR